MARLPAPRRPLPQFGFAFCLLLALCLPTVSKQQSTTPPPVPSPKASAQELEDKGDLLRAEKRYLDSVDFYKAAIAKQPSVLLWNKEGMAYLLMQNYDEATKCFNRAIKMDKHDAAGYNNRGYMEYRAQKYDRALQYCPGRRCRCGPLMLSSATTWARRISPRKITRGPRRSFTRLTSSILTSSIAFPRLA